MNDEASWPRPLNSVDGGLQHERTALAWERTAIAMMVAGLVLVRYAENEQGALLGSVGVLQTASGAALLLWASRNDDLLHNPDRPANAVPQVWLTRVVGLVNLVFIAFALVLVGVVSLIGLF